MRTNFEKGMKTMNYTAPEMEIVKLKMAMDVMLTVSTDEVPGVSNEEVDDENGAG